MLNNEEIRKEEEERITLMIENGLYDYLKLIDENDIPDKEKVKEKAIENFIQKQLLKICKVMNEQQVRAFVKEEIEKIERNEKNAKSGRKIEDDDER